MNWVCSKFIRMDAGNSIHQRRVLRFRLALALGLCTALIVAVQLIRKPDNPEIIIGGLMIWMPTHQLLYLRRTAASIAASQRYWVQVGIFRYGETDRRQVATTLKLIYALTMPFMIYFAIHHLRQ